MEGNGFPFGHRGPSSWTTPVAVSRQAQPLRSERQLISDIEQQARYLSTAYNAYFSTETKLQYAKQIEIFVKELKERYGRDN